MRPRLHVIAQHSNCYRLTNSGAAKIDRHLADDILKCIFLNENVWFSIKISLKFLPKRPIDNIPALVQIMAWYRPRDKPLSERMIVRLPLGLNELIIKRNNDYKGLKGTRWRTVLKIGMLSFAQDYIQMSFLSFVSRAPNGLQKTPNMFKMFDKYQMGHKHEIQPSHCIGL